MTALSPHPFKPSAAYPWADCTHQSDAGVPLVTRLCNAPADHPIHQETAMTDEPLSEWERELLPEAEAKRHAHLLGTGWVRYERRDTGQIVLSCVPPDQVIVRTVPEVPMVPVCEDCDSFDGPCDAHHPAAPSPAPVSSSPTPKVGDRVRATIKPDRNPPIEGVVVAVTEQNVSIQQDGKAFPKTPRFDAYDFEVLSPEPQPGEVWDFEGLVGLVVKRPHFVDLDVVWSDGSTTLLRHCVGPMRRLVPADGSEVQP